MSRLLVLDSSYSLEIIRARRLEYSVTCRDLDGFFSRVWTAHPFASLVTSDAWARKYGKPQAYSLSTAHVFIEGKVGRFALLRRFPVLNFIIGQVGIFLFLKRLVKQEGIDVIRVGDPLYLGLLGWALARACGIPFAIRVGGNHDKMFEATGQPLLRRLFYSRKVEKVVERFVLARADLVGGANQDNLDFALSNGTQPEVSTIFRYGNLIDQRHFVAPQARTLGRSVSDELGFVAHHYLLCISRLERVKHIDHVVRVLARLRQDGHDMKLLLVGDGQLKDELGALARELGVAEDVIFCGNRDQEWLAQVVAFAAVVLSPCTGRALSEAALGAAPIVAYDIDWQGELIETGVTGELVPYLDWRGMADSAKRYLDDPAYARCMGDGVRNRALEMLDPAALNQKEREHYAELLLRVGRRKSEPPEDGSGMRSARARTGQV